MLGPDGESRLRGLPARQREIALSEIATAAGTTGWNWLRGSRRTIPSQEIVVKVVQDLAFRRGDRHVNRIMQAAPDAVWRAVAKESFPERLTDMALDERLSRERAEARAAETDPVRLLQPAGGRKTRRRRGADRGIDRERQVDGRNNHFDHAIVRAHEAFPGAVAAALMTRIAESRPLPYGAGRYLDAAALVDDGPIAAASLDPGTDKQRLEAAAAVVGPATLGRVFEQLFAADARIEGHHNNEELRNARWRLADAIAATRQEVFVEVLLAVGRTEHPRRIAQRPTYLRGMVARGKERNRQSGCGATRCGRC